MLLILVNRDGSKELDWWSGSSAPAKLRSEEEEGRTRVYVFSHTLTRINGKKKQKYYIYQERRRKRANLAAAKNPL